VYFHGLVRDAKGQKMSKSLGNALDPLEIAAKYGADAGRMALIFGTAPGTDSKISEDKIKGQKHFANKIWNITRFVMAQPNEGEIKKELREEFDALAASITKDLDAFRLHTAAETLYNYIWTRFADEILETSKKEEGYGATLHYILEGSLTLLHPFMPFVTEKLWELTGHDRLLMVTPWPQV
jgi:valyl-tRNA synthetase